MKAYSGENSLLIRAVAFGALGLAALTGCSASSGKEAAPTSSATATHSPAASPSITPGQVETKCKAVSPDTWQGFPRNFDPNHIAQRLGVPAVSLVTGGRFGAAVCEQPVEVARIPGPDAPVVSVEGEGSPCLVIGTKEDPRTITQTPNILAVCAPSQTMGPTVLPTT